MKKSVNFLSFLNILSGVILTFSFMQSSFSLPIGKYTIEQNRSKVGFSIRNLGIMNVYGKFDSFAGDIQITEKFENSKVNATVETQSINTEIEARDKHLRSNDFFDVEKFPKMIFIGKSITGNEKEFKITGDLTIKGITKQVIFTGKSVTAINSKDEAGKIADFEVETKINRQDFNVSYGSLTGDEVTIKLKIYAVKK